MPTHTANTIDRIVLGESEISTTPKPAFIQRLKNILISEDFWNASIDEAFQSLAAEMRVEGEK